MSKFLSRTIVDGTLLCVVDGTPYTVQSTHPAYNFLVDALRANNADDFLSRVSVSNALKKCCVVDGGNLEFDENTETVLLNGQPVDNLVVNSINEHFRLGLDIKPLMKFLERLLKNPSKRSVEELWRFLNATGLSVTEDGCFLAYKTVRSDYYDKYSGTFLNTVGQELRMPRNEVDDDFRHECSYGFHVGSLKYSGPGGSFHDSGDKVIIVKVPPEDVVSVPLDYQSQKLRTCSYTVVADYVAPLASPQYSGKVNDDYSSVPVDISQNVLGVSPEDLLVGNSYTFSYHDKERTGVLLDEISSGTFQFLMGENDPSPGCYRTFKSGEMSNIRKNIVVSVNDNDEELVIRL